MVTPAVSRAGSGFAGSAVTGSTVIEWLYAELRCTTSRFAPATLLCDLPGIKVLRQLMFLTNTGFHGCARVFSDEAFAALEDCTDSRWLEALVWQVLVAWRAALILGTCVQRGF